MNACIWCEEAESGQILGSETKSRDMVCEEISTYRINLSPPVCSPLDTMGGLGHCTHYTPCRVAWKTVVKVPMGLRNSVDEPLWISLNPLRIERPVSPRTGKHPEVATACKGWTAKMLCTWAMNADTLSVLCFVLLEFLNDLVEFERDTMIVKT